MSLFQRLMHYSTSFTTIVVTILYLVCTATSNRINNANRSACVGDDVTIPSKTDDKCTNRRNELTVPSGEKITHSTEKYRKVGEEYWIVKNVGVNDGGEYISRLSCDEGIKGPHVNVVKVNCKRVSVRSDAPEAKLKFRKPLFNGEQLDILNITIVHTEFKNNISITVFEKGNFTVDAFKYFGKAIEMNLKTHTLTLTNVQKKFEGNYTSIWSALIKHNRVYEKFILIVTVSDVQSPSTTVQPRTGNTGSTDSVLPTGERKVGGEAKITLNTLCFIVSILITGFLAI